MTCLLCRCAVCVQLIAVADRYDVDVEVESEEEEEEEAQLFTQVATPFLLSQLQLDVCPDEEELASDDDNDEADNRWVQIVAAVERHFEV